ncbi:ribosomal protein S18-alanine N-acetyltransferase [Thiomicrorhabdus aquaedulcis]|uniref:ribosomal protein S18-alanine N-acetyltransferase n=1 Tax=Thiomicrorhabdus aquaedulcis TaxID=2211106 RepID=UPI0015624EE2|nr:ribosomal protein S18-alanine N-acetyltransferase [Thiomicrorhabdus aquaedulcis]
MKIPQSITTLESKSELKNNVNCTFSYIRVMQEADLDWVLAVENNAYDFPWSRQGFENSLDQGLNYVFCTLDHTRLGYCCMLPVLDEVDVLNICIVPQFQGTGVAKQAMQKVLDSLALADYKVVFLEVRESNEPALKLYSGLGFNKNGVRHNYYKAWVWDEDVCDLIEGKEDAILMLRSLQRV